MEGFAELIREFGKTVLAPIQTRPYSSAAFFLALLAAEWWYWLSIPETFRGPATVFAAVFVVGLLLSVHRMVVLRDEPSRLVKPEVLEEIKKSFVGRDDDAVALVDLVLRSKQVWLSGDSGVGKSALLVRKVIPDLERTGS